MTLNIQAILDCFDLGMPAVFERVIAEDSPNPDEHFYVVRTNLGISYLYEIDYVSSLP